MGGSAEGEPYEQQRDSLDRLYTRPVRTLFPSLRRLVHTSARGLSDKCDSDDVCCDDVPLARRVDVERMNERSQS